MIYFQKQLLSPMNLVLSTTTQYEVLQKQSKVLYITEVVCRYGSVDIALNCGGSKVRIPNRGQYFSRLNVKKETLQPWCLRKHPVSETPMYTLTSFPQYMIIKYKFYVLSGKIKQCYTFKCLFKCIIDYFVDC